MKHPILSALCILIILGCAPQSASDKPDQGSLVEINNTKLFCKTVGEGEPLLIIHGGPGLNHQYLYDHLMPLAESYKLIFYDQRASGKSSLELDRDSFSLRHFVEDIEGIRKHYGINRLNIVAHSWGALPAMKYAIRYPGRVRSMILVSSVPATSEDKNKVNAILARRISKADSLQRNSIIRSEEFKRRDPAAIDRIMRLGLKYQFRDTAWLDSLVLGIDTNFIKSSDLLHGLRNDLMSYDLLDDLDTVQSPVLLIYGDYDPLADIAGYPLKKNFSRSRMILISDCGHFPFVEKKNEFTEIVKGFLKMHGIR